MLAVGSAVLLGMGALPAHPNGMTNHHIECDVVFKADVWVGRREGHQREQAFRAQLAVFSGFNATEQVLDLNGEVAFSWRFFEHQGAGEPVAPL